MHIRIMDLWTYLELSSILLVRPEASLGCALSAGQSFIKSIIELKSLIEFFYGQISTFYRWLGQAALRVGWMGKLACFVTIWLRPENIYLNGWSWKSTARDLFDLAHVARGFSHKKSYFFADRVFFFFSVFFGDREILCQFEFYSTCWAFKS